MPFINISMILLILANTLSVFANSDVKQGEYYYRKYTMDSCMASHIIQLSNNCTSLDEKKQATVCFLADRPLSHPVPLLQLEKRLPHVQL
jgi:hypothetical protein